MAVALVVLPDHSDLKDEYGNYTRSYTELMLDVFMYFIGVLNLHCIEYDIILCAILHTYIY